MYYSAAASLSSSTMSIPDEEPEMTCDEEQQEQQNMMDNLLDELLSEEDDEAFTKKNAVVRYAVHYTLDQDDLDYSDFQDDISLAVFLEGETVQKDRLCRLKPVLCCDGDISTTVDDEEGEDETRYDNSLGSVNRRLKQFVDPYDENKHDTTSKKFFKQQGRLGKMKSWNKFMKRVSSPLLKAAYLR